MFQVFVGGGMTVEFKKACFVFLVNKAYTE